MAIADQKIKDFLEDLASEKPTPGGGAAAAIAGAMGAGLVGKVARLTKNNPKVLKVAEKADKLKEDLLKLSDEDCQAYNEVIRAYRLPKEDKTRGRRIQEALKQAAEVPMETVRKSVKVLYLASFVAAQGNQNAVSDARCAVELATAAIYGALENVRINLSLIKEEKFRENLGEEIGKILAQESLKVG